MAAKARAGYAAYCRQDFIGADYGLVNYTTYAPAPDYWLLVLWKRLVGARVLSVAQPAARTTRAYAFCAAGGGGSATLVLVNLAAEPACYTAPRGAAAGAALAQYSLAPGDGAGVESARVALNGGAPLALDAAGRLPPLPPAAVAPGDGIALPPLSVTLLVVPLADAAACA